MSVGSDRQKLKMMQTGLSKPRPTTSIPLKRSGLSSNHLGRLSGT